MIEIPNWVVQVAAVWFLLEKVALFEKRTKEWANRRAYKKARKENEEAYNAGGYEDFRHVPPDQFPRFEDWLKDRERGELQRKQAEKEQSDLELLKTFNRKRWEQIMSEKVAKESQEHRERLAYLESIRPPDVSKITCLQWHGIFWHPPLGWVAEACGITPASAEPGDSVAEKGPTWAEFEASFPADLNLSPQTKVKSWGVWGEAQLRHREG